MDASAQIEDKYQKGNTTLNMRQTSLCIPNTISFTMMHQKNDIFGTQRQIRRRQMNISYSEEQSASQKSRKPNIKEVRKTRHSDSMKVNRLLLSDEALSDEMAPDRSEDDAEFHELAGNPINSFMSLLDVYGHQEFFVPVEQHICDTER